MNDAAADSEADGSHIDDGSSQHYSSSDWFQAEEEYDDEVVGWSTIPELVDRRMQVHGESTAFLYKGGVYDRTLTPEAFPEAPEDGFASLSYSEVQDIVRTLATGFDDVGVESDEHVAIYSSTRVEWTLADYALLSRGAVVTTVYPSSSPEQTRYLLDDPDASTVVVENQELLERVLEVEDELSLERLVVLDEVAEDYLQRDDVYTAGEVHRRGRDCYDDEIFEEWLDDGDIDDVATVIYTSGTTGRPKGVELTHRNLRSSVNQMWKRLGPRPDKPEEMPVLDGEIRSLAYLPLAHAFERFSELAMVTAGASMGFAESTEPEALKEDIQEIQPTGIATVPRLLEKIYDAVVEETAESPVKRRVFEWSVDVGQEVWRFYEGCEEPTGVAYYTRTPPLTLRLKERVADRLVYSRIREALGGEIEVFLSAGGSLPEGVARTYLGMGLPVVEGYGMTESAPVVSLTPPEEPRVGTMGPPLSEVEVDLDRSEVGDEFAGDVGDEREEEGDFGELLVRGDNIFDSYLGTPEETEEAFRESDDGDGDPWFRTGDVVEVDSRGFLRFVDRVKNLVVLSTGKNVAVEPLEDAVVENRYVDQCMVVGDDRKFVGALLVPAFDELRRWARENDVDLPRDPEEMMEFERVQTLLEEAVDEANSGFEDVERIKDYAVVAEEWTEDDDLLTPTLKKKRRNIRDRYDDDIEAIYEGR